jgi:hypothetical protein
VLNPFTVAFHATETKAERLKDEAPQKDPVRKEDAPKAEEKPPKPEPEHLFDIRFVVGDAGYFVQGPGHLASSCRL